MAVAGLAVVEVFEPVNVGVGKHAGGSRFGSQAGQGDVSGLGLGAIDLELVNARLGIRRGEIRIAVQEVTGVFGVRVPTAAPGKPYVELSLNARLPSENVLARGVAPGQVTRREVW